MFTQSLPSMMTSGRDFITATKVKTNLRDRVSREGRPVSKIG